MPVRVICPHCQRHLRLPEDLYEGPVQCPCCHGGIAIRWHQRGLRKLLAEEEETPRRACRSCGEKIPLAARECPFCGAWVKSA